MSHLSEFKITTSDYTDLDIIRFIMLSIKMHDFLLNPYIENIQIWAETNMNPRTKLPARKSLFSSKPITAYGFDEYIPPTDPKLTQHLPK